MMWLYTVLGTSTLAALLVSATSVATSPQPSTSSTSLNTLTAYLRGNPKITGLKIQASANGFYLGYPSPATYCPLTGDNESFCPPGNETVVFRGGIGLSVLVPGGQQSVITPEGAFYFVQAHSATVPTGSYYGSFTLKSGAPDTCKYCNERDKTGKYDCSRGTDIFTTFISPDEKGGGIYACPPPYWVVNRKGIYQLFGKTPKFNSTGCFKLGGLILHDYYGEYNPILSLKWYRTLKTIHHAFFSG